MSQRPPGSFFTPPFRDYTKWWERSDLPQEKTMVIHEVRAGKRGDEVHVQLVQRTKSARLRSRIFTMKIDEVGQKLPNIIDAAMKSEKRTVRSLIPEVNGG